MYDLVRYLVPLVSKFSKAQRYRGGPRSRWAFLSPAVSGYFNSLLDEAIVLSASCCYFE